LGSLEPGAIEGKEGNLILYCIRLPGSLVESACNDKDRNEESRLAKMNQHPPADHAG